MVHHSDLQAQREHAARLKSLQGELAAVQKASARYEAGVEAEGKGQLQLETEQLSQYSALKEKANQATVGPRQQLEKVGSLHPSSCLSSCRTITVFL